MPMAKQHYPYFKLYMDSLKVLNLHKMFSVVVYWACTTEVFSCLYFHTNVEMEAWGNVNSSSSNFKGFVKDSCSALAVMNWTMLGEQLKLNNLWNSKKWKALVLSMNILYHSSGKEVLRKSKITEQTGGTWPCVFRVYIF